MIEKVTAKDYFVLIPLFVFIPSIMLMYYNWFNDLLDSFIKKIWKPTSNNNLYSGINAGFITLIIFSIPIYIFYFMIFLLVF